jgi:hypothetical protein
MFPISDLSLHRCFFPWLYLIRICEMSVLYVSRSVIACRPKSDVYVNSNPRSHRLQGMLGVVSTRYVRLNSHTKCPLFSEPLR